MNWIRSAEPWIYPDIDRLYPQIMANYWNLCVFMSLWNPRNFWFCRLETSRSFFIVPSRGVGAYHWCTAHRKRGHPVSWWALFHFSDVSCLETWFQCFNAAVFSQFSVVWWCLQVLPKPPWNILGRVSRFILKPSQQCTKEPWPMAGLGLDRGGIPSFFFLKCWDGGWEQLKIKIKQFLSVSSLRLICHVLIWNCLATVGFTGGSLPTWPTWWSWK